MHHPRPQVFAERRSRFRPRRRLRFERLAAARAGSASQDDPGDDRRRQRDLDVVVRLARALLHPRQVRGTMRARPRPHVLHRGRIVAQRAVCARMAPPRMRRRGGGQSAGIRFHRLGRRQARIPRRLLRPAKPGLQGRNLRLLPLDLSVLGTALAAQPLVLGPQPIVRRVQRRVLILHLLEQTVPEIGLQTDAGGHMRHGPSETPAPSRLQSPRTQA